MYNVHCTIASNAYSNAQAFVYCVSHTAAQTYKNSETINSPFTPAVILLEATLFCLRIQTNTLVTKYEKIEIAIASPLERIRIQIGQRKINFYFWILIWAAIFKMISHNFLIHQRTTPITTKDTFSTFSEWIQVIFFCIII